MNWWRREQVSPKVNWCGSAAVPNYCSSASKAHAHETKWKDNLEFSFFVRRRCNFLYVMQPKPLQLPQHLKCPDLVGCFTFASPSSLYRLLCPQSHKPSSKKQSKILEARYRNKDRYSKSHLFWGSWSKVTLGWQNLTVLLCKPELNKFIKFLICHSSPENLFHVSEIPFLV